MVKYMKTLIDGRIGKAAGCYPVSMWVRILLYQLLLTQARRVIKLAGVVAIVPVNSNELAGVVLL